MLPRVLYHENMIMPLEQLIEYDGNVYEITVAITRRAYHLAVLKTPEVEKNNGKVVSRRRARSSANRSSTASSISSLAEVSQ